MNSDYPRIEKQHGHEQALSRDLNEYFEMADQIEVIIEEPPSENGGEEAKATTNRKRARDAVVFITPGSQPLHRGDRVRCRLTNVHEDYLKGISLIKLD